MISLARVSPKSAIARLVQEDEQRPVPRVLPEVLGHQPGEPVDTPAQVDGRHGDVDGGMGRDDHHASSTDRTSRSRAGPKPGRTRTTRPDARTISSALGSLARGGTSSTGTKRAKSTSTSPVAGRRNLDDHQRRVPGLSPSWAAKSSAARPLFLHCATRFCHGARLAIVFLLP
jgi:hypothetical protein